MAICNSHTELVPAALRGPVLVNPVTGIPRYWSTVWMSVDGASYTPSTLQKKLNAIDALYLSVERQLGDDKLDQLIFRLNFEQIEYCIAGFFSQLSNESVQFGFDASPRWSTAFGFIKSTLDRYVQTSSEVHQLESMHAALLRLERLYSSLRTLKNNRRPTLRALPATVVADLYDISEPNSPRNPFRTKRGKWRNYILLILMLHQGLRRGEALLLPSDSIKEGRNPDNGKIQYWLNVVSPPDTVTDDRSDKPSIKTMASIRQIPVAEELARLINSFSSNWRGKQPHPFLFSNAQGKPLSLRYVGVIFEKYSQQLSPKSRQALINIMREPKIKSHDLRHTCAVVRLTHCLDSGMQMDETIERLRAFFGWGLVSQMPRYYTRAYFENDLLTDVWKDSFDAHVEALRQLDSSLSNNEDSEL